MTNKPKLLFFAPNHFGIDKIIYQNLVSLDAYDITVLDDKQYRYKNIFERIYNQFYKFFFKKNFKKIYKGKRDINILKNKTFDISIVIRPDLLSNDFLAFLNKITKKNIVIYWDSMEKIPDQLRTIEYFNYHYSFDFKDCAKYNLKLNTNFYINDEINPNSDFDVFYFGSLDNRISDLQKIFDKLEQYNLKIKSKIYSKKKQKEIHQYIEFIYEEVNFKDCYKFSENTKVVVDLVHKNQIGLSMRPFEALGLKRKLITTNTSIKDYDFYNPNNIFIIEDINNFDIPTSFFESEYEDIEQNISSKYHIKPWLENILKT
ncbi:lipopolysaccharide core biosynthesis protein rfaS [Paenimyroides tangerinum]|uniref:Lipopolysaccharide core biosynthesis protein rfaS n=1 Tax=Paenimyroides tangerinum TaxID=2488728 RepID=A0A3P3WGQ4_9FLAO|nr:lipopolysaccharide core biosynthesis protein rfaS [Paenimyroides tangerinum]RRJ93256.1 lipopolysaccharide core biosynthesis protein rfaS [Paenimyroides tangerinum]